MNTNQIRKAELHCHSDELINPNFLKIFNKKYPSEAIPIKVFESICPVKSYNDWISKYIPIADSYVENNGTLMLKTVLEHIEQLKLQNVVYAEIMIASVNMQYSDIDKQMCLYKMFRDAIDIIEENKIQVELLIALGRSKNMQSFEKKVERALFARNKGLICGVTLAGIESEVAVKEYNDYFKEFKKVGMGIEIHAGEWCGPESVWDALEYGYPDRIGHGLAIFEDPILLKHVIDNNIHIEFCPTSNLRLTSVKSIDKHPIGIAIKEDMNFSINTDDPGPFCCNIDNEFKLIADTFGLGENDFSKILNNTLKSRFSKRSIQINEL